MFRALHQSLRHRSLVFGRPLGRAGDAASSTRATSTTVSSAPPEGNPLLDWYHLPPYDRIVAREHVVAGIRQALTAAEQQIGALERQQVQRWDDLFPALEEILDPVDRAVGTARHLKSVCDTPELREALAAVQPEIVAFSSRVGQSQDLFAAYQRIRQREAGHESLSPVQRRILDLAFRDAERSGVGLSAAARSEFNTLSTDLAQLSLRFSSHVLDDMRTFTLLLRTADEVAGLPATVLAEAAHAARQHGHSEASATAGPWLITMVQPSFGPFLQHSRRRDLREQVFREQARIATHGAHDNTALVSEILHKRHLQARLLGRASYADLSLEVKMAGTVARARDLLDQLYRAAKAPGERERLSLAKLAQDSGASCELQPWDYPFWMERMRESLFGLKDEETRPYFPLPRVLNGLFDLAHRLFGVQVRAAAEGEAAVWHPDVRLHHLADAATGERLASFFLDPFARKGKNGGAWMNSITEVGPSRRRTTDPRVPVAVLVCNNAPASDAQTPPLLSFREVETLFHEFGHALQHMCTRVPHAAVAGIAGVEWDAVELPSQFMENWCVHEPTLRSISGHYRTGAPLPDTMAAQLRHARNFLTGIQTLRQLFFASTDLAIHSAEVAEQIAAGHTGVPHAIQERYAADLLGPLALPQSKQLNRFSHLFAGGYAAGYYSYKWAEVLSADAFAAFEEAGLDNPTALQQTGRRYRETVLALGGSAPAAEVFARFRGRAPTPEAFFRHSGLRAEAPVA